MSQSTYFDLHTQGLGYLNRIREVTPKRGQSFWACDIAALNGRTEDANTTRFDCRVSGTDAVKLVRHYQYAIQDDRKVLIGFRLGDLYVDTFTYSKGEHAGETGFSLKARLLYIGWMKIDGQLVYTASGQKSESRSGGSETDAEPTKPEATSQAEKPESDSESGEMPAEVALSKDDPDFQERKAALKEAGYRFDGQNKVWRLPQAS